MANRIEAILEGKDVQPQNSYEAALKQHVASGGSGGGAFVVNATMSGSTLTCDKTAAEMFDACQTGIVLIRAVIDGDIDMLTVIGGFKSAGGQSYIFGCYTSEGHLGFTATGGDSYPQTTMG